MPPIIIPSLTGGVSRQPPSQRHPSQCEEVTNATLFLQRGNEKRPGTEFIKGPDVGDGSLSIAGPTSTTAFYHWIDRDPNTRFIIVVDDAQAGNDVIQAFDLTGAKKVVNYGLPDPKPYVNAGAAASNTKTQALTVANATFILNQDVTTALTGGATTYAGASGDLRIPADARNVNDWTDFTVPAVIGQRWYANDDAVGHPAGFYEGISTTTPPWYKRIKTEPANSEVDDSTMPIRMDWDVGAGEFDVTQVSWTDRYSGDSETNPGPSFIGQTLSDMAFFRDRFYFGSSEQLASSQTGDLFNLWNNSYVQIVDSDPIDVTISENEVNNITFLVPFSKVMVIMTDNDSQFELRSPPDEPLSPSNVNVTSSTNYPVSTTCRPAVMGAQLYFTSPEVSHSKVYEYFVSRTAARNVAVEVTQHCPGYVRGDVTLAVASKAHDILFLLTDDDTSVIYLYHTAWADSDKLQSAWCKWKFDDGIEILSIQPFDDYLYMLIRKDSKVWLERVYIADPPNDVDSDGTMPYSLRMDRKHYVTGTYDAPTDITTWTLAFKDLTIDTVVLGGGWGGAVGKRIAVENDSSGSVTLLKAQGDHSAYDAWVGRSYEWSIKLSEQFFRTEEGTVLNGNIVIRQITVFHKDTGQYEITVTPTGRQPYTFKFTGIRLGGLSSMLGNIAIDEFGKFHCVPLISSNRGTIELKNSTPLPTNITNIQLEVSFVPSRNNIAH